MAAKTAAVAAPDRDQMNVVIVGHVDHGKSTVVGRLLADTTVAELSAGSASLEDAFFQLTSGEVEYRPTQGRAS